MFTHHIRGINGQCSGFQMQKVRSSNLYSIQDVQNMFTHHIRGINGQCGGFQMQRSEVRIFIPFRMFKTCLLIISAGSTEGIKSYTTRLIRSKKKKCQKF